MLAIAETTNKTVSFENVDVLKNVLKNPPVQRSSALKSRCARAKKLWESRPCQYDRRLINLEPGKDYDIGENLQSWLYFDRLRDEVRKALTFADDIVWNASQIITCLRRQFPNTTLVGIHNRRGDLVTKKNLKLQGYVTAPADFFQRSMTYFRRRFSKVTFIVLGENREWSTAHILPVDNDVVVLQPNSPAVDLQILSMTDHMIRTVGTFGWWAAFKMAGRPTVVYLKDFANKNAGSFYSENAVDYMMPSWLPM